MPLMNQKENRYVMEFDDTDVFTLYRQCLYYLQILSEAALSSERRGREQETG